MERHGEDFFEAAKHVFVKRVFEGDRELFLASFTRENILRELEENGAFTATYRLIDSGDPVYASAKITRMYTGGSKIILGINIVESQMRQQELFNRMQRERDVLRSVAALAGSYLGVYSIDPETGRYIEYAVADDYESLGLAKEGDDFFKQCVIDGKKAVHPDDLSLYLEELTKENVMREIDEHGAFNLQYRLATGGQPRSVNLKIARVEESGGEKLVAGVRLWQTRQPDGAEAH